MEVIRAKGVCTRNEGDMLHKHYVRTLPVTPLDMPRSLTRTGGCTSACSPLPRLKLPSHRKSCSPPSEARRGEGRGQTQPSHRNISLDNTATSLMRTNQSALQKMAIRAEPQRSRVEMTIFTPQKKTSLGGSHSLSKIKNRVHIPVMEAHNLQP